MRLSNDFCPAACRLIFTALMAFAWCGGPTAAFAQSPARPPDPADLARQIEAAERNLPRDTFDPAAVVQQVGREPAKLFRWVQTHTAWVPYTGCLRGPAGVLMDRVGSNLDRALLLAELLRTAGAADVKLARATLSEEQAKRLAADAVRPPPADAPPAPPPPAAAGPGGDAAAAEVGRMAADVARRGEALTESLAAALGAPAGAGADGAAATFAEPWKALTDHWWVQVGQGGSILHMDPTPADGPGAPVRPAAQTYDLPNFADPGTGEPPAAAAPAGALPAELWHEVRLRVVVEQAKGRELKEAVALTRTLRPATLHGQRLVLHHFPLSPPPQAPAPGGGATDLKTSLQRYRQTVLATREWFPMLEIGTRLTGDASVTDAGDLNPNPQLDALKGTGKTVGKAFDAAFDVFGSDPPPAPAAPPASAGLFTASWVEYEIRSPNQPPKKVRRQVFDLIGPAARAAGTGAAPAGALAEDQRLDRALALGGRTSLLVLGAQPSPPFVQHVMTAGLKAHLDLLPEVSRPADQPMAAPPAQSLTERLNKVSPPLGELYGLALVRHAWSPHRARIYLDRPNVLTHHAYVRRGDDPASLLACEAIDIAANDLAVKPPPAAGGAAAGANAGAGAAGNAADARRVLAAQGVFDTVAETAFAGGCGVHESAAGVLAAAKEQGVPWVALRGAQDPALQSVELPADERARVARELADGMTVVIPRKPVKPAGAAAAAVAYWRIDPATGATLGIGRNGWGPSMVERGSLQYYLIQGSEAVKDIRFLSCSIAAAAVAAAVACSFGGDNQGMMFYLQIAAAAKRGCTGGV